MKRQKIKRGASQTYDTPSFFIISSGLFQKHHREVLLGMSLFRWKLQLEFIANGQLEHIGITIAMLRHLGDTDVVAGIQDDVLELV